MFKNFSAGYYQKIKERLQERAHERYQGLPEKKKEKKREYGRKRYRNLSDKEKRARTWSGTIKSPS